MVQPKCSYFTYATAHGPISICANAKGITHIAFEDTPLAPTRQATELTNRAATQIQEYLAGKRRTFDVPVDAPGSAFQHAVWAEVCAVPYGETRTAADIAAAIGRPGSHRSVGTAIRQNPCAPLIPTHRVLAASASGKEAKILRGFQALEARNGADGL